MEGIVSTSSGGGDGGASATLLVRHLPALPPQTLKSLFTHYGALDLRLCQAGRLKNCAFLDFPDDASAARAQSQLHRVRFLGKTLTAEKSRAPGEDDATKKSSKAFRKSPDKSFLPRSHSSADPVTGSFVREPIAPSLGVDYPFPPHLEYAYPPPDDNILSNISSALIAVPSFYTQVLHLMNKMNLPAPFRPAVPKPPLPCAAGAQERPLDLASDESELESSEEEDNEEGRKKKRRRKEVILGPATAKDASHEAAGVKPVTDPSKAVTSIKKKQPVIQIKIPPKVEEKTKVEEKHEEVSQDKRFATREELEKGKLSLGEVASHPVFKNYSRGTPSPVLYIKNLEKEVVLEDLHYVFGAFFPSYEEAQAGLNVKLMQVRNFLKDLLHVLIGFANLTGRSHERPSVCAISLCRNCGRCSGWCSFVCAERQTDGYTIRSKQVRLRLLH
ncbi:U11/U12 small nuclear ribonucleoprotein 65 kDa protein isoform X2 [Selaginella moellendorffii]|uniref:U11/U12 small nuclear ribonucleoprotein 65 kDa protein isoform X2 n=1 Tax=Selaginella moellendorffii TaxID=88036 RepID=UPI000D1CC2D6|nr:U11/U12 small nuclear ribonucleoprotein 65 kDa protein isoform X2 [Selaginella moellendorffii]|eukprot:XP_024516952.1 U11/U12 small nuclear ribonucleoprotein 65 kDa protein isoform X2 [Selaginella moellendorffii]